MVSLIEAEDTPGNLENIEKELAESVRLRSVVEQVEDHETVESSSSEVDDEDVELPERMRGKSKKEIFEMYRALESRYGTVANDLGTQRKLTDRLLDLKRESDLKDNSPAAPQVSANELLDSPTQAIERVVAAHLAKSEQTQRERYSQLEGQLAAQTFNTRHPDWQQIASDPSFHTWVRGSSFRARAANAASQGDWAAADDLVTEYKERKTVVSTKKNDESHLEAARNVGLEKSGAEGRERGSGRKPTGKIFRRIDLLELQINKPDVYYDEATQREIMLAYQEGRVK